VLRVLAVGDETECSVGHAGDIVAWGLAGILGRVFGMLEIGGIWGCDSPTGAALLRLQRGKLVRRAR